VSASVTDRTAKLEAALAELLRLYDWRFKLGHMEAAVKAGNLLLIPEVNRLLRKYGEEKKAAWEVARAVLLNAAPQVPDSSGRNIPAVAAPHVQTDRCGFDRNASLTEDTYVCTCGWSIRV
jgi:hypothetical protein